MDERVICQGGYEVTGIDISPDMIAIAKLRDCNARFLVSDYEDCSISGKFDAAVIYGALHHADDAQRVVKNIYDCLSTPFSPAGVAFQRVTTGRAGIFALDLPAIDGSLRRIQVSLA
jgi:SAM-dependent methyltransferase